MKKENLNRLYLTKITSIISILQKSAFTLIYITVSPYVLNMHVHEIYILFQICYQ